MKSELNIKALYCFQEVMRQGSVTKAGIYLELTQSTVSKYIARLEKDLRLKLFIRDRGRLAPTQEAQLLFKEVDYALKSFDRLSEISTQLRKLHGTSLSIVAPPTFVEAVLADLISDFLSEFPKVKINIDSRSQLDTAEMVSMRKVDCGFIKDSLAVDGLKTLSVVTGSTVCAMLESNPLASKPILRPEDLIGENVILLGKGSNFRWEVEQAFSAARVSIKIAAETHSTAASCALAAAGVGVSIVNNTLVQHYRKLGLRFIPFKPEIKHQYNIIISDTVPPSQTTQAFIDFVTAKLVSK